LDAKTSARQALESVGFDLHETSQYVAYVKKFAGTPGKLKGGFRWFYLCAVGIGAGAVAVTIQFLLKNLNEFKFHVQEEMFHNGYSLGERFAVWISICMVLAAIAGAFVCYVEPLAGGSGIPEIKCILNGIDLPNVLRLRTLGCKALGIVCSVGAGLPCGKEGPMIHSGAIVAAQATTASAGPLVGPYQLSTESRDFIAAGAAAGVAAAFGAPIGGVLFAVEEGASHMNPTILVRTFVCAAMATLTVRFFAGPMDGTTLWGTLGTDVPVEFGRFDARRYRIWELAVFGVMGVAGGLCGALFNWLNTRLSMWRTRCIGPRGHLRYVEVLLVTLTIVSFNFFAPLIRGGSTNMGEFCAAQKLFVDVGGHAIKELFHNEEHIDQKMLLFFALVHYAQTILTYGLGVPSGLFVPSLLGGAAFGRMIGQEMQAIDSVATTHGLYALIGATAMLSGMARITISLVVILMETTGEAEWGIPIFLTVMAAKWTGDLFNKGIYDIHIDLRHVPLLEHRPEKMLELQAHEIMAANVKSLPLAARVGELVDLLESCRHAAFPVVEPRTQRFIGLAERSTLLHVLRLGKSHDAFTDPTTSGAACQSSAAVASVGVVPYEEMLRQGHPRCPPLASIQGLLTQEDRGKEIDLRPYTNMGCYTMQEHAAFMRCHMLFRSMGLRHLPVLGEDGTLRGMITRKDLVAAAEHHEQLQTAGSASAKAPEHVDVLAGSSV